VNTQINLIRQIKMKTKRNNILELYSNIIYKYLISFMLVPDQE